MSVVRRMALIAALLFALGIAVPAAADSALLQTARVSAAPGPAVDGGTSPQISDDAGTIVFASASTALVPGDTNGANDVFAYSVDTGTMSRVSVASDGSEADGDSSDPAVSADGTAIVFVSSATNLDAGPLGTAGDLYLHDVTTGGTTRITKGWDGSAINGSVVEPQISADGSTIVYASFASNLVPNDSNAAEDVFAYDVTSATTTRISVTAAGTDTDGPSSHPSVSADGSTIVYESAATDIVAGDTNTARDVFAYDAVAATTTRVSLTSTGDQLDDDTDQPAVSADGTAVVFASRATNVVDIATQPGYDIFVRDLTTGEVTLISVATDGTPGDGPSHNPRMSADGSTVVYESDAANLVTGDANAATDVMAHDIPSGATTRVSLAGDGTEGDAGSSAPVVNQDGTEVAYQSDATTLTANDDNSLPDVFLTQIVNRSPVVADATLAVPEDAQVGDMIGSVPAVDPDGDDLMFTVTGGDDAFFAVDRQGKVITQAPLDFETKSAYELTVDVTDGHFTEPSSLSIEVTNVNEKPVSSDFDTSVLENEPIGTAVDIVSAADPDGDPLTFTVTHDPGNAFAIDAATGVITTTAVFDYETATEQRVTVAVSDGTLTTEVKVVIDVVDVNEAPILTGFTAQTPEDAAVGTFVGSVSSIDPEADAVTFEITGGNAGNAFSVDNTGAVTVAGPLDYETVPDFALIVSGSDGVLTGETIATIHVGDVYEVDPAFDPFDDDGFFEVDIEWLAYSGITKGCGPRLFCPNDPVTREQLAVFLVRALSLPQANHDYFTDDEDSSFEDAINRLAGAGITKGCNPSRGNTDFCPQDVVSRGEMAAFLVRALGYADNGGGNLFTDDDDSIFADAIDKLAAAGITRGCNPPENDHYCPDISVTRGQIAAFLHRALS